MIQFAFISINWNQSPWGRIHSPWTGGYSQLRERVFVPRRQPMKREGRYEKPIPELILSPQSGTTNSATGPAKSPYTTGSKKVNRVTFFNSQNIFRRLCVSLSASVVLVLHTSPFRLCCECFWINFLVKMQRITHLWYYNYSTATRKQLYIVKTTPWLWKE